MKLGGMDMLVMRQAEKEDQKRIEIFAAKADVKNPPDHISDMIIVENEQQEIIAMIAIEAYETVGLLRSFVVMAKDWDAEKTVRFFKTVFACAKQKKIDTLYLFTAGHTEFLSVLGFKEIDKKELPKSIQQSPHAKHPNHAVAMCCSLNLQKL
jgi:amino-acid N-acetyltransferase